MTIESKFREFVRQYGEQAYTLISQFFDEEKEYFYAQKKAEYLAKGYGEDDAINKTRQGWVSTLGASLEKVIAILLEEFCQTNSLKLIKDKDLNKKHLSCELDKVRRAIVVHLGEFSVLPDADLIIYQWQDQNPKILCVLSVKNSFRERYTQTPYWKLKLSQSEVTQHIKVYIITLGKDDEISENDPPRKAGMVMEYELDGIYLAKEEFTGSDKVKSIQSLIHDLEQLL